MRYLTAYDTYESYFKDRYVSKEVMIISFYTLKQIDKNKTEINKKYLVNHKFAGSCETYFKYIDIVEYLKYTEHVNNTITYAKQLIVDIESLFEFEKVKRFKSKLARNLGVSYQEFSEFEISYNYAVKFIEAVKRVITQMSSEGRKDLIRILQNVTQD